MSAQITTIFPANITLPKTIIGALDGSSSMYIENPWFPKPMGSIPYNKELSKVRVFKDANGAVKKMLGTQFITPRLFMRAGTEGPFTNTFTIRYGDIDKSLKPIMVKKPYLKDGKADMSKFKVSLSISPSGVDRISGACRLEDEIMLRLDHIYCTVLEFVLIAVSAKFAKFEPKDDDKTLISKLCAHLGHPDGAEQMHEDFYKFFEQPPTWDKTSEGVFYIQSLNPRKQYTIMNLVKILIQENERVVKMGNELKKTIKDKRCSMVPCFRKYRYDTKKMNESGEPIQNVTIEAPLKFHLQIPGVTPVNFPPQLFTKTPKREHRNHVMDFNELQSFYGVYNNDYNKAKWSSSYEAALFMGVATEYAIYANGQPKTQWFVETIIYKRQTMTTATQSAFEDEIFDAIEGEIEEMTPVKELSVDERAAQLDELMDEAE